MKLKEFVDLTVTVQRSDVDAIRRGGGTCDYGGASFLLATSMRCQCGQGIFYMAFSLGLRIPLAARVRFGICESHCRLFELNSCTKLEFPPRSVYIFLVSLDRQRS